MRFKQGFGLLLGSSLILFAGFAFFSDERPQIVVIHRQIWYSIAGGTTTTAPSITKTKEVKATKAPPSTTKAKEVKTTKAPPSTTKAKEVKTTKAPPSTTKAKEVKATKAPPSTTKAKEVKTTTTVASLKEVKEVKTTKNPPSIARVKEVLETEKDGFVNITYEGPYASKGDQPTLAMHVPSRIFKEVALDPPSYITLDDETAINDVVFATAANPRYYRRVLATIQSMQQYFPSKPIIFYDLGLMDDEVKAIKSLCGIEYHKFDFSQYPEHVKNPKNYSWKPMVIYEMLRRFSGVLWMDASIRLFSNSTVPFKETVSDGFKFMTYTYHSTFAATDPMMYKFVPTNYTAIKTIAQRQSGFYFVYRTKKVYEQFVQWAIFCAFDKRCFAPRDTLTCPFKSKPNRYEYFLGCHRFDQSLYNLLIHNAFERMPRVPSVQIGRVIRRGEPEKEKNLKRCS